MSPASTRSSGLCGRPPGRPTIRVPTGAPRARMGTAIPSVGVAKRTGPSAAPAAALTDQLGEPLGQLRRQARGAVRVQHRAQLGQLVLVGVGERGQPQPAQGVDQVHGAPPAEPGDHDLRHHGDGEIDVEGLAEQLAGLGQVGHPGPPALVHAAQPLRLHRHRHPVGDQLGEVPGALRVGGQRPGSGVVLDAQGAAQRRGHRQPHLDDRPERTAGDRTAGAGQLGGAAALVDLHADRGGLQQLAQPTDQLGDQLAGLQPVDQRGRHVQQPAGLLGGAPHPFRVRRRRAVPGSPGWPGRGSARTRSRAGHRPRAGCPRPRPTAAPARDRGRGWPLGRSAAAAGTGASPAARCPRSVTATVTSASVTVTASSNSVPACSTAFSQSSLASSTAVSSRSSGCRIRPRAAPRPARSAASGARGRRIGRPAAAASAARAERARGAVCTVGPAPAGTGLGQGTIGYCRPPQ